MDARIGQDEFPEGASEWQDVEGRRRFLKLMTASLAMAGVPGCITSPPLEEIVPYVNAPEGVVPGRPQFYATTFPFRGYGHGVLVESHEGRPTKIEGNPDHPASLGGTNVFSQASVLDLYDPARSKVPMRDRETTTLTEATSALLEKRSLYSRSGGRGFRILTESITSPTLGEQLRALLRRYPEARWYRHDPVNPGSTERDLAPAPDRPTEAVYHIDRAHVLLSLESDFLFALPGSVRYARLFADRRRVRHGATEMNRLYVVESTTSITGAAADHRLALGPSAVKQFVRDLAAVVLSGASDREVWVMEAARDLLANRGRSLVIAGKSLSPESHSLVHQINAALGAPGSTIEYITPPEERPPGGFADVGVLVEEMRSGQVDGLIILGGNPAYTAPADLDFGGALKRVPFSLHLSLYVDETSASCRWHLPQTHYLESWSDLKAFDGTSSIVQPLIAPLYEACLSSHRIVFLMEGSDVDDYEAIRAHWRDRLEGDFESTWFEALRLGFFKHASPSPPEASLPPETSLSSENLELGGAKHDESEIEIVFAPDPTVWDGSYANNPWLQELPKPHSKQVWGNSILLAPAFADRLGVEDGQALEVSIAERKLVGPAKIAPGHADRTLTLFLGYGRPFGEDGEVLGYNAYSLRTRMPRSAQVRVLDVRLPLVTTQGHHRMEGRHLVKSAAIEHFRANPEFVHEGEPISLPSLYPEFEYPGYKWGMVIDLNVCIGCNACIVACQAENNIPTVGRDEVARGREMHWLRVDQYHHGPVENPEVYFQPVPCMHCEKAPCEVVCPVYATVHDSEGLNVMVYNRCIGTRYCSNNCPYKVRRFNFLQYADWHSESGALQKNPDVTVRSRGVMEKCTYCVQRISAARIGAKKEDRTIRDGEVMTACQTACPTRAITFGDLNDETSTVHRLDEEPHRYELLHELGTRPRTKYLAHFRNRNEAVEPAPS